MKGFQRKELIFLKQNAKKFLFFPILFFVQKKFNNDCFEGDFKLTVSINRKIGKAVARNKIRRRVKALFHVHKINISTLCIIQKNDNYSFHILEQSILNFKKKIHHLIQNN